MSESDGQEKTQQLGDLVPRAATRVAPALKVLAGPGAGRVIRLDNPLVTLGRGEENDVPIDDPGVSRQHCKFVQSEGRVLLVDLNSTNGTFLNNEKVRSRALQDGALIVLGGSVKLRFLMMVPEESELEQQLYDQARFDSLTGALNRTSWLCLVSEQMRNAQDRPFSVAVVDIDHFKKINDAHGHPSGDRVLIEFCRRTRGLGKEVLLGRWGGEEFVFFFHLASDRALKRLERLREEVANSPFPGEHAEAPPIPVTFSAGLVDHRHGDELGALISLADQALYQAKKAGRNRIQCYQPETPSLPQRRRQSRKVCQISVQCHSQGVTFDGEVRNLSIGGLKLETSQALDFGAEILIRPKLDPSSVVRVGARWRDKQGRLGTQFLDGPEVLRSSWVGAALKALGVTAMNSQERRHQARVEVSCDLVLIGRSGAFVARLLNLGVGGLAVALPGQPEVGQPLMLELGQLIAPTRVVWTSEGRCGLSFFELDESQQRDLRQLVLAAVNRYRRDQGLDP